MSQMMCNQCEECAQNVACTVSGVCGKEPELSSLLDQLKEACKIISKQVLVDGDATLEKQRFVMHSMFKLITNANFNKERIMAELEVAKKLSHQQEFTPYKETDADLNAVKSMILSGLMGMCAYHSHAINLGYEDEEIHQFLMKTLAYINEEKDLGNLLKIVDETGAMGVKVMALLDKANTETYGTPELSRVQLGVGNRPGILISGHDLCDLEQLLKQSEESGVDIYTHSEMLPAHYYPNLKKYSHLVGNYGNAWWKQTTEFKSFHGPILFTTNCIVPPSDSANYKDQLYATGDCDFPGFKRIKVNADGTKDFSEIIDHAKKCEKPEALESGELMGGFAHQQVLSLADKIVENIKNGSIRKFIVMSGCDGRKKERSYYTEFAQHLEKDTIILTSGCAKYRYNKLDLGDINGIPRLLDAGQCNDSYSLAVVALKLKEVFGMSDVNELPLSFNIAWYEQKAIIVLLALLHLGFKNIQVGPTLPGYLTPATTAYLVDNFGLTVKGDVAEDIERLG
ncbi:MAG: hydroxylamine reductase [Anaerorhabdus sp.]